MARKYIELPECADSRGHIVRPTATVAYNLSGTVALGEVVKIVGYQYGTPVSGRIINKVTTIHIRFLDGSKGFRKGHHISKVKDTSAIMRV